MVTQAGMDPSGERMEPAVDLPSCRTDFGFSARADQTPLLTSGQNLKQVFTNWYFFDILFRAEKPLLCTQPCLLSLCFISSWLPRNSQNLADLFRSKARKSLQLLLSVRNP